MDKTKVLITIDWFDPAYKAGGPIMSIIKLVENMREYYDFYILTGSKDYGDSEPIPGLVTDVWQDWRGMAMVYYLSEKQKSRSKVFAIMDEMQADIYYIQGVFSLYFSIYPLIWWHQAKQDKVIIATRGMFHASALQEKKYKKLLFLYAARIMGWYHHVIFHSTNPEETMHLKKIIGNEATYVEASNFPQIIKVSGNKKTKKEGVLRLLNVARISPEKNSLFLLDTLRRTEAKIELTVIGNYADEGYFQQFMKKAEALRQNVKVEYVGHKPIAELRKYYEINDVFILPTRGENFGHAIIESLSVGLPCIISKNTPWNGLEDAKAGFNLDEDAMYYSNAIEKYFFMSMEDYMHASDNAIEYARSHVNIDQIKEAYLKLLS